MGCTHITYRFYHIVNSVNRSCRLYNATTYKCTTNIHKNQTSYVKDGKVRAHLQTIFLSLVENISFIVGVSASFRWNLRIHACLRLRVPLKICGCDIIEFSPNCILGGYYGGRGMTWFLSTCLYEVVHCSYYFPRSRYLC